MAYNIAMKMNVILVCPFIPCLNVPVLVSLSQRRRQSLLWQQRWESALCDGACRHCTSWHSQVYVLCLRNVQCLNPIEIQASRLEGYPVFYIVYNLSAFLTCKKENLPVYGSQHCALFLSMRKEHRLHCLHSNRNEACGSLLEESHQIECIDLW